VILEYRIAQCWGFNGFGELGDGTNTRTLVPKTVRNLNEVVSIGIGYHHTCAIVMSGIVKCWGSDDYGQVGDNRLSNNQFSPVSVVGLPRKAIQIALSLYNTCALLSDGSVYIWGNVAGFREGGTKPLQTTAFRLPLLSNVIYIRGGMTHYCVILKTGALQCFGNNIFGQLGDNTTSSSTHPVDVYGLSSGVIDVAPGDTFTCALLDTHKVKCWGDNTLGQLGDGTTTTRLAPTDVTGLSNVTAIGAGAGHVCVLLSGGIVQCWGDNSNGQLGTGSTISSNTSEIVPGLSNVKILQVGSQGNCVLLMNNAVKCWGYNNDGEVGGGPDFSSYDIPVPTTVIGYPGN